MKLRIFGGPNGSGKSTVVESIKNKEEQFQPHPAIHICPDNYIQFFDHIDSVEGRYKAAMDSAEEDRWVALLNGVPFSFETVFSSSEKLEFMKAAQEMGYEVEVVFVTTKDPSINVDRVRRRVTEGGHDVPKDKIIQRYKTSMALLPTIVTTADLVTIYDNSDNDELPLKVFIKRDNEYIFLWKELRPDWCNDLKAQLSQNPSLEIYDLTIEETIEYSKE